MFSGKTIFIAPLDWGLGHATRCVPLIRQLSEKNRVILGITPLTAAVLQEEFPSLPKVALAPYSIHYSGVLPLWLKLLSDWPRISAVIRRENAMLEKIIKEHSVDIVISDSRFGLYTAHAHCIFITHQVFLKTPLAERIAQNINKKYILRFDEVWIPDFESESECLSGELSHGKHFHPKVKYIGPLSRLPKGKSSPGIYHSLFIVSGPSPHAELLQKEIIASAAEHASKKFALVSPVQFAGNNVSNLDVFHLPEAKKISALIEASAGVVCRSGYSTLMDLHKTGVKRLHLIPTPGQSEQEYLAAYWSKKFAATVVDQKNLTKGLRSALRAE